MFLNNPIGPLLSLPAVRAWIAMADLSTRLAGFHPRTEAEARDVERGRALLADDDPLSRSVPLHVTGSALVVDPVGGRILLRWHERQQAWLQVGGHADPGEVDPYDTARREAVEETGLTDLVPWPAAEPQLVQVVAVPVPSGKGEPAHEHLDLRFLLATATPELVRPENPTAALRWLSPADAEALTGEENLRVLLRRVGDLLAG
jgi:8-oxo-dGTP pyrophosphatase MutT (NUDIX family)